MKPAKANSEFFDTPIPAQADPVPPDWKRRPPDRLVRQLPKLNLLLVALLALIAILQETRACNFSWETNPVVIDYPMETSAMNYAFNSDGVSDYWTLYGINDACVSISNCGSSPGSHTICINVNCPPTNSYPYVVFDYHDSYWPCYYTGGFHISFPNVISCGSSTAPSKLWNGSSAGSVQISCGVFPTIYQFYQGWDTTSNQAGIKNYCGLHKYYALSQQTPFMINFYNPWFDANMPFQMEFFTDWYGHAGTYTIEVNMYMWNYCCGSNYDYFTITLLHPCKISVLTSPDSGMAAMQVNWDHGYGWQFQPFSDSQGNCYGVPNLCALSYSFTSSLSCGFYFDPYYLYFDFYTSTIACKGQTVLVTVTATSTVYPSDTPGILNFNVVINDPCTTSHQTWTPITLRNMQAIATVTTDVQTLDNSSSGWDEVSSYYNIQGLCGPVQYFVVGGTPAYMTISSGNTLTVSGTLAQVGVYSITLQAQLVNYPAVSGDQQIITVTIQGACPSTTLSFNPTLSSFTITAFDGVGFTQSFSGATDSMATSAGNPSFCGPRVYTILEGPPVTNFVNIVYGANEFVDPFNLNAISTNLADVGTWTVTIQVKLLNYPQVPAVTKVITNVVVKHPCTAATINSQTITTPLTYQIVKGQLGPTTLTSFMQNTDSAGTLLGDQSVCGVKKFVISPATTWLSVLTPTNSATQPFALQVSTDVYLLAGTYSIVLQVSFVNTSYPGTFTQSAISITLLHPCKVTTITVVTQVSTPITHMFMINGATLVPFTNFADSVSTAYGIPTLCALTYSLTLAADATNYGVTIVAGTPNQISINPTNSALVGTSVMLSLSANAVPQQDTPSQASSFQINVVTPCTTATISFGTALVTMTNQVYVAAVTQTFTAASDSISAFFATSQWCGAYVYTIIEGYAFLSIDPVGLKVSLQSNDYLAIGTYTATFKVTLSSFPAVPPVQVTFQAVLTDPCLTTVLTLPTTLSTFSITTFDGVGFTQTFMPATDTAGSTAAVPGLCGPRIYTIVEAQPKNFMSIVAPAGDAYTQAWTLNALSNNISDVGTWTITLQATLLNYPGIPAVTKVIAGAVVKNPCEGAVINAQPISAPVPYQIVKGQLTPWTVSSFYMHTDSAGIAMADPLFCGVKVYTISPAQPWLSVLTPSDPLTQPFEFKITTDDYAGWGTYVVSLTVSFSNPIFIGTYVEASISFQLLPPCKITQITVPTPVSSPIVHPYFTAGMTTITIPNFADSVATAYGIPTLCALVYTISLAADATAYNIAVVAGAPNTITINTQNIALKGTTVTLTLSANAVPQQDTPGQTSTFNVMIEDTCLTASLNFGTLILTTMTHTVTQTAATQAWSAATDSLSMLTLITESCGPFVYLIVEAHPFLALDTTGYLLTLQTANMAYIGSYTATLKATLANYPGVPPVQIAFPLVLVDPCLTTVLTLPTTLSTFQITSFDGIGFSQTFMPATDTAGSTAAVPGLCGPRVYTIVEAQPKNFMSIVAPAGDAYTQAWTLNALSNNISDVGTWTITLQVTLLNYPGIPAVTKVIAGAIVKNPCEGAIINAQPISAPVPYQIVKGQLTPWTVSSFYMHTDSAGIAMADPLFCGVKVYTISPAQPWLSVLTPSDPLTQPFEFKITTDDYAGWGTYVVSLTVSFSNPIFIGTYVEASISFQLLPPCKITQITVPTPVSSPIVHPYFTAGMTTITIPDFADSVATAYGIPTLCALVYTISMAADATAYDIAVVAGAPNTITINTQNIALKGTTVTLTLSANAVPQQDTPGQTSTFNVVIQDTCLTASLNFGTLTLTTMTHTVTQTAATQAWSAATDSLSMLTLLTESCGPFVYSIVEAHPFLALDTTGYLLTLQTANMAYIGSYTATLKATLANYPGVPPVQIAFPLVLVDPCLTTVLTLPTLPASFVITAFDGIGFTQTFMPATDSAADIALVPSLCGPRTYVILEAQPLNFISIVPPAGDGFINPWTIFAISNSFVDVGVWAVTLQVTLETDT